MHKNIIVGEGRNDLIFLHEMAINFLNVDVQDCDIFLELRNFERVVQCNRQKRISLICGGGTNLIKSSIKISRSFWSASTNIRIGVMGDSDAGSVYDRLIESLTEYIKNKNRVPVHNPVIHGNSKDQTLLLDIKSGKSMFFWTAEVPNSLEWQIEQVLKNKYKQIDCNLNDEKTIDAACAICGVTRKEVIRQSVNFLSNEKWFSVLLNHLQKIL